MLKGINPVISPELLKILASMGHGDLLVIGDANYPCESSCRYSLRADGISATELLDAILQLFPLDFVDDEGANVILMAPGDEGAKEPEIWQDFREICLKHDNKAEFKGINRFEFYKVAEKAFAAVQSGETRFYGCIIIRKGVIG